MRDAEAPDAPVAWVLNLDSDVELAVGPGYTPGRGVVGAMRPHVATLARSLVGARDVVLGELSAPGSARGAIGRAYCPTPRAIAMLERAGAVPEPHPSFDILRSTNSRAFAASLGQTLPGAAFVSTIDEAFTKLANPPPIGDRWRVKRAFGMSGRGQRVILPGVLDHVEKRTTRELDRTFVVASLEDGGVQIEPNVSIDAEYALHGKLARDGALTVGRLVRQRCDERGAWLSTEPHDDARLTEVLTTEVRRVAKALTRAGYFGPFGVDAFTYAGGELQPRSEINARYSMGFAIGFRRG